MKKEKRMMEVHYHKLLNKYKRLKTEKDSLLEECGREENVKYSNYVSAAEDTIEYLKRENERLKTELSDQMAKNRDESSQLQQLLTEEKAKTKALSGEVEKLLTNGDQGETNSYHHQIRSPVRPSPVSSRGPVIRPADEKNLKPTTKHFGIPSDESEIVSLATDPEMHAISLMPNRCEEKTANSGDGVNSAGHKNCLFQTLLQHLVGMNFSLINQVDGLSILVLHQSSGYSFMLTVDNCESEVFYHLVSLGAFERVAPEWMREDMIFGMNMCAIFFDRVLRVLKRHR